MDEDTNQEQQQQDMSASSPANELQPSSTSASSSGAASSGIAADYASAQEIHENEMVNVQAQPGLGLASDQDQLVQDETEPSEESTEDDSSDLEEEDTESEEETQDDEVGKAAIEDDLNDDQTKNTDPNAGVDDDLTKEDLDNDNEPEPGEGIGPEEQLEDATNQEGGIITGQFNPNDPNQSGNAVNNDFLLETDSSNLDEGDATGDMLGDEPLEDVLSPDADTSGVESIIEDAFGEDFTGGSGDVGGFIGEGGGES